MKQQEISERKHGNNLEIEIHIISSFTAIDSTISNFQPSTLNLQQSTFNLNLYQPNFLTYVIGKAIAGF